MRARIVWIVAGIGAAAAIVAWLSMRGDTASPGADASHPDRGTASEAGEGEAGGSTPGPRRNIPPTRLGPGTGAATDPGGPGAPTLEQAASFDTEPRDDGWATATEQMLRPRMATLADAAHVKIGAIECRTRRCRVRIEAQDQNTLGLALSKLGEPGGLYDVATQMVVSAPQPEGDGATTLDVYGEFAR